MTFGSLIKIRTCKTNFDQPCYSFFISPPPLDRIQASTFISPPSTPYEVSLDLWHLQLYFRNAGEFSLALYSGGG